MLNGLWISAFGDEMINWLGPVSLLLVGMLVEKNFVGRITTFTNALAINLHVYTIQTSDVLVIWYANIGLVLGVIALFSYGTDTSMSREFYLISWLYSSLLVFMLMVLTSI